MPRRFSSVFDIVGPVMVGPSSSHTAGAARIGMLARRVLGEPPGWAICTLYDSFALTGRGHGTDRALIGGLLGMESHDPRLIRSLEMAEEAGLKIEWEVGEESPTDHPNSVRLRLTGAVTGISTDIHAVSEGGGQVAIVMIDGFSVRLTGLYPALLVFHRDVAGVIAKVTSAVAAAGCNIARMEVARQSRGQKALMVMELDQSPGSEMVEEINNVSEVYRVRTVLPE
ncbi:MAG: L-serine ammonia-lyase, iron-sulfur-dependent subunit beta [Limnochordia bacterium]|jgi:L-serine dehydratase